MDTTVWSTPNRTAGSLQSIDWEIWAGYYSPDLFFSLCEWLRSNSGFFPLSLLLLLLLPPSSSFLALAACFYWINLAEESSYKRGDSPFNAGSSFLNASSPCDSSGVGSTDKNQDFPLDSFCWKAHTVSRSLQRHFYFIFVSIFLGA